MELSNIVVWNVRGLNKKSHRDAMRTLVSDIQLDIVCLQETKIQQITSHTILTTLGSKLDGHLELPAQGTQGGVLVAWRSSSCQAITTRRDMYSISVLFQTDTDSQWWFTGVYGPQPDAQKLEFMEELRDVRAATHGPWVIAGDFNLIYRAADKNNSNLDRAMMGRFRHTLNILELREVELLGRRYTWSNERLCPTLVRLDRVFCTNEWDALYPNHVLQGSVAGVSDHCPLVLSLHNDKGHKGRFHFEKFWPSMEGFQEIVREAWSSIPPSPYPLQCMAAKLRATSKALQSWGEHRIGNVK